MCWDRRCEPLQLGFFFPLESDYQALLPSESSCCPLINSFPGLTLALYQKPFLKKLILLFLFVFQYVSSFESLAMKLWLACNSGGSCLPLIPEHWCLNASIVGPCFIAQVVLKLSTCRGAPSAGITSAHRHAQAEVALFCELFGMNLHHYSTGSTQRKTCDSSRGT